MKKHLLQAKLSAFASNESGATAIEYGLIIVMLAIATVTSVSSLGDRIAATFEEAEQGFDDHME